MSSRILSFSLSDEDVSIIEELAEQQNRSRSQIVQEAVSLYATTSKWQSLRKVGDRIAKQLGIESDDDVEVYFG